MPNDRSKMVDCPRCGGKVEATGREFKFGVFDGKQFRCRTCEKYFNAFYRDGNLKYTVPKTSRIDRTIDLLPTRSELIYI